MTTSANYEWRIKAENYINYKIYYLFTKYLFYPNVKQYKLTETKVQIPKKKSSDCENKMGLFHSLLSFDLNVLFLSSLKPLSIINNFPGILAIYDFTWCYHSVEYSKYKSTGV